MEIQKRKNKILIANRGEIAVRIIRAAQLLGLQTVAVYAEPDQNALHVAMADDAVKVGPASLAESYLNQDAILAAAEITGCTAIHPGYGLLSENADFAQLVEEKGFIFIGPTAKTIRMMGNKSAARQEMAKIGVPIVTGSHQSFTEAPRGLKQAEEIGYPVMLKAVGGGGGKGMRVVERAESFTGEFQLAQQEVMAVANDKRMYLEKFVDRPRHIEIQVLGDGNGHGLVLGDRDCTIQHRHQKMIEEAPSVYLDESTRQEMFSLALKATESLNYRGAGTFEFLYQGPGRYYFMEMNTRIQVEHAVTEERAGIDLISAQLALAFGTSIQALAHHEQPVVAIEARVLAKNAGKITGLHLPAGLGIRIETAIYQGYRVPSNYDAMILKIIATDFSRENALKRLRVAIDETVILGIETNLDLLSKILYHPDFIAEDSRTDINWLDRQLEGEN
ncbi:acetyl-CoA carboxylase biotin carboxylase subunit [Fructobacillus tropaeoli]|uniref:acetyl-CoA carboxylase biotin carboxylase subunit n=1 Tax=Fructobacillus tropaeoli TaxID=709323 RepID=UPI0015E198B3|nr:biotin carboxylase N-terminal domain-containing protein [Fructobacillus tropaeoli]